MRAAFETHPYGFLVTAGHDSGPRARLVQHVSIDDDLSVWIGTSPNSRKVHDIERSAKVTYAVEDRESFAAVVLTGDAAVVTSVDERVARWADGFEAFFPGGPGGDDFVLIRVVPNHIEVIDFAHGIHPEPYGLVAQHFRSTDDGWVAAEDHREPRVTMLHRGAAIDALIDPTRCSHGSAHELGDHDGRSVHQEQ